jgi:hypothetical protein
MTQLTQTQRRTPSAVIAGVALAAALLGGIVGNRVEALVASAGQHAPTVSAHDQAVIQAGKDWEARYRQMYPSSR